MKKKHLNTLKIASLTLMLGCFAVGGVYNNYQDKQQDNVVKVERKVQPKYASYDDEHNVITLTPNEINNYTFQNLYYYLFEDENVSSAEGLVGILENITYDYNDYDIDDFYQIDEKNSFGYAYDSNVIGFDGNLCKFKYYSANDDLDIPFDTNVQLNVGSDFYNSFKNAIELDIQANQPVSQGESIIGAITSGLGIIPNIAGEFLAGFSKLLWNNNQLTNFAIYSLVFLGIAITFAVIKLVLAIVRGNTGA